MSNTTRKTTKAAEKQTEAAQDAVRESIETAAKAMNGDALRDMAVPEAVRSLAETSVTQSREAYERAKDAMEETVETFEKSLDKAGEGAAAINRKMIDMVQANLNSGFDLAKALAGARNVGEILELQAGFARQQFEVLAGQAEELRALSAKVTNDSTEPFKAYVTRSFKAAKRAG